MTQAVATQIQVATASKNMEHMEQNAQSNTAQHQMLGAYGPQVEAGMVGNSKNAVV